MDTKRLKHIAILPDGNRRWAKERGLSPQEGHSQGFVRSEEIIQWAFDNNLDCLTLWGASMNNLSLRAILEVQHLYAEFQRYFERFLSEGMAAKYESKVNILGCWRETFPPNLKTVLETVIDTTKNYTRRNLNFMLGYNGDQEMLQAITALVQESQQNPNFRITGEALKSKLYTAGLPAVDLLIRTGGEPHNSVGFMMWDTANSQYYFTETLYPDFGVAGIEAAVADFEQRDRRVGK